MDTLTIKGMKFRALHGVHNQEKKEGNDFEVDVIFYSNLKEAGQSDRLTDAIDYAKIHKMVSEVMNAESVNLIERLCLQIGQKIKRSFPGKVKFEVAVRKLNPPLEAQTKYTEARMSWPG